MNGSGRKVEIPTLAERRAAERSGQAGMGVLGLAAAGISTSYDTQKWLRLEDYEGVRFSAF